MTTDRNASFAPTAPRHEARAAWIQAVRLRTLPLAAAGSILAAGIAAAYDAFRPEVFALMFLVSIMLQIIANFADDYGDLSHGLDDETRVGPKRGMQRGIITPSQMKCALAAMCIATFALGCLLIYVSLSAGPALTENAAAAAVAFVALGIASIAAAVLYTVGRHPYGYMGLGDIMSFIFFGLVAVVGGTFLYAHAMVPASLVAGVALGLPVAAVMNVNNMRDSTADAAKGKRTIANRLYARGERRGLAKADGKRPEEIAAMVAVLEHGPRVDAAAFDAIVREGGHAEYARVTAPKTVASLTGELYMRGYHFALGALSLVLFIATVLMVGRLHPFAWIGAAAMLAAATPLMRAILGACRTSDHTKLDRFMAPTSMGTVLACTVCAVVLALL